MNVITEENKGIAGQMVLQGHPVWTTWTSQQLKEPSVAFEVPLEFCK